MIAAENGGCFGLVLETAKAQSNEPIPPGSVMIKREKEIRVILPSSKDPLYFSALMLWAHFAGSSAPRFAKDNRLPDFVRTTIAGLTR